MHILSSPAKYLIQGIKTKLQWGFEVLDEKHISCILKDVFIKINISEFLHLV